MLLWAHKEAEGSAVWRHSLTLEQLYYIDGKIGITAEFQK